MKHSGTALVVLALLSVLATQAKAADEPAVCRALDDDASRLACYDRAAGRARPGVAAPASTPDAAMVTAAASPPPVPAPTTRNWWTGGTYTPQTFAERWELDPGTKDGVFKIKAYQPTYVMIGNWRKNTNPNPCSPNPQNCASGQEAYMHGDAKFQISAKTKLWQDIFDSPVDLWAAYTQQTYWQVYDSKNSRPFRETDFQPEAWVTLPLKLGPEGLQWRMLNLGMAHQSNGQEVGDYAGRLEVQAVLPYGANVFSATVRNNLKNSSNTPSRTSVQADWAFPLYGQLHGYVQAFYGWNDSLQNYNFRNTGVGIGVSLTQWR